MLISVCLFLIVQNARGNQLYTKSFLDIGLEVFIEQKDPDRRILIAVINVNDNSLSIHMQFPPEYPNNKEPLFKISKSTYDGSMETVDVVAYLKLCLYYHIK